MSNPVVFDTPTLGRAVCLGELYDARSGKFLGVQLYPLDKVKEVETNIRNTELTVSLSTTHHQKATLLDINAKLSLDVLGGLVKVSGSASYLNDEKSNTNEYAYALALKMRLKEKRMLFAEPDLGRQVLSIVEKDYINTKLATHFVSSIVYGGNYIVNLVARQTEMSKEEKIEGKLQASFDKLKGAISLDGSVEATIKGNFEDMDAKFDLVVHGDVALDKVPVTPKDVLDTFPEAASLITDGGGVPISVTLQPIPQDLYKAGRIHQIEENIVDTVLAAYSDLDDLRSRFLVLQDNAKRLQDFIPELARTIRIVSTAYIEEHGKRLHELATFLQEYKLTGKGDHEALLCEVNKLYNEHLGLEADRKCKKPIGVKPGGETPDTRGVDEKPGVPAEGGTGDDKISDKYPSTLVGLEDQLSRFQYLVADIRTMRQSLSLKKDEDPEKAVNRSFYLSSLEDVCRAIRTQSETPLFIMVPIFGAKNHDLIILKYLAMVRKYSKKFEGIVDTAHMFYAENLQNLEDRLPNDGRFIDLNVPSFYIGTVSEDGELSWAFSPPIPNPTQTYALVHQPSENAFGYLSLALRGVNSKESYSILFLAREENPADDKALPDPETYRILRLETPTDNSEYYSFWNGFGVKNKGGDLQLGFNGKRPEKGKQFTAAFVQNAATNEWVLYLDGEEIDHKKYKDVPPDNLQIGYPNGQQWWNGSVSDFRAYSEALSAEKIKKLCSAPTE